MPTLRVFSCFSMFNAIRRRGACVNRCFCESLCQMLWEIPSRILLDQAATAASSLGGSSTLEPRSDHKQTHQIPPSIQRPPALRESPNHLEHQLQRTIPSLHPARFLALDDVHSG